MKNTITRAVIIKVITYFGRDIRRINHALKVHAFAKAIGEAEIINDEKLLILELTAILHDVGIKESEKKYNSSSGNYQEIEGPPVACELLADFNLKSQFIDRICYIIGNHHTYSKIDDIDFQILVEADFLVNIFEDNFNDHAISIVKRKHFKTASGISFLDSMFQN